MKITKVDTLHCDAGWRVWSFVKIETDTGISGYGECSNPKTPLAVEGAVRDLMVWEGHPALDAPIPINRPGSTTLWE